MTSWDYNNVPESVRTFGSASSDTKIMASGGETLTTIIAVVGCGLSIYNTVTARLDKRPKVKLKVAFGMVNLGNGLSREKVFFEISNGGSQASQIVSLYIPLPSKSKLIVMPEGPSNLPASVIANGAQTFWMDYRIVYDTLVREGLGLKPRFRAYATDALGKKHYSKAMNMPPIRG